MEKLVAYVQQYALDHYEDGGWDIVAECFGADEIAEQLIKHGATDEASALDAFAVMVDVWADRQADARNSAF